MPLILHSIFVDCVQELLPCQQLVEDKGCESPTKSFTFLTTLTTLTPSQADDPSESLPPPTTLTANDTMPHDLNIVPNSDVTALLRGVETHQDLYQLLNERSLYMLLLAVLESVSIGSSSGSGRGFKGGSHQIGSSLHLLHSITTLFNDVLTLWLQAYNTQASTAKQQHPSMTTIDCKEELDRSNSSTTSTTLLAPSPLDPGTSEYADCSYDDDDDDDDEGGGLSYKGTMYIARIALRLWLTLSSQILHCSHTLSAQQLVEIKQLLVSPLSTVATACFNLQLAELFKGNDSLDHEFTLIILESFYSCVHAINLLAVSPACSIDDLYQVLKGCLSDDCHEWFTYLCSKLHAVSSEVQISEGTLEDSLFPSNWEPVLLYSNSLLTDILQELIVISTHIHACQKASKMALSGEASTTSFFKPVAYNLEVAAGFDKLTQRLSRIAQLLLDMFRTVPKIQLLSLQLLSETAKDTVGTIGNFLSNIADPSVRSSPEVLDLYLELLENVWFRLSPDYNGPPSFWKKLSNYHSLLLESNRQVVCQVIFHIQCLFSHESTTLKSELTKHVIIPFHTHLTALVRQKCFTETTRHRARRTPPREGGGEQGSGGDSRESTPDVLYYSRLASPIAEGLEATESEITSLFLKLLLKVVGNVNSLSTFAAESANLYSLFLLLPLEEFKAASLCVLRECMHTLQSTVHPLRVGMEASDETVIQRTILRIFLNLAYSVQVEKVPELCISISEGRASLPSFGLNEVDQVHQLIRNTFELKRLEQLATVPFVKSLAVVSDVWEMLSHLALQDASTATVLVENHLWDVVQVFSPFIGSLLSRIQQRLAKGSGLDAPEGVVTALRETCVSLLSHLLTLAHFLCWQRRDMRVSVCVCVCVCVCG